MIKKVIIQNWKNIKGGIFDFERGINILIAPNGYGKTAILEAIYFSLTGEVRTQKSFKTLKRIDSSEQTEITLHISMRSSDYEIKRTFNGNYRSYLYEKSNLVFQRTPDVNQFIRDSYEIKKHLFTSLIYLSEGEIYDLFRLLTKKEILVYVEGTFGLDKINDFKKETQSLNRYLHKQEKQIKVKRMQIKEIQTHSRKSKDEINAEIKELDTSRKKLKEKMKRLDNELVEEKSSKKVLEFNIRRNKNQMIQLKVNIQNIFKKTVESIEDVLELKRQIINEISRSKNKIAEFVQTIESFTNEVYRNSILIDEIDSKLETYEELTISHDEECVCPLCDSLLSIDAIKKLDQKYSTKLTELEIHKSKLNDRIAELKLFRKEEVDKKENLEKIQKIIINFEESDSSVSIKENKLDLSKIINKIELMVKKRSDLEDLIEDIDKNIHRLEKSLISITQAEKLEKIELYEQNLKSAKKGRFFGKIITRTLEELTKKYRKNYLNPFISELTDVWTDIYPDDNRRLSITDDLIPTLKKGEKEILYSQVSAGEKTLLSIIVKTLMIKYLSKIPFIILDEPLEHLDEENRTILADYLYKIVKDGLIKQLIFTTYEESIIRRLRKFENVKIISLESMKLNNYFKTI